MNYFADINIIRISEIVSRENRMPRLSELGALGVMFPGAVRIVNGKSLRVDSPLVYWSIPGRVYAWRTPPGGTRHNLWISATGERFQRMLNSLHELNANDMLPVSDPMPFVAIIRRMEKIRAKQSGSQKGQAMLALCMEQFVSEIYNLYYTQQGTGRLHREISAIAQEILANPVEEYDFHQIARENGISYDHFRLRFKEYSGVPLHEFCLQARLDQALKMLSLEPQSIKEIAWECGFRDASDFARYFRKKIGCSPSTWRQNANL